MRYAETEPLRTLLFTHGLRAEWVVRGPVMCQKMYSVAGGSSVAVRLEQEAHGVEALGTVEKQPPLSPSFLSNPSPLHCLQRRAEAEGQHTLPPCEIGTRVRGAG